MRTPLRPLARILQARQEGLNPDSIEKENLKVRHEALREKARGRAQFRLFILCISFVFAFGAIGARMGLMAATEPVEPKSSAPGAEIIAQRADITDRNGRVLATNMTTHALYAHPKVMVDPKGTAAKLAEIFPELDAKALERLAKELENLQKRGEQAREQQKISEDMRRKAEEQYQLDATAAKRRAAAKL